MTNLSDPPGPWGAVRTAAAPEPETSSISLIALGLLVAWVAVGVGMVLLPQPPKVLTFVFVIVGWILAVSVHEFCHAWVARRAGDTTVEAKGYLTLNPLKYADPVMSVVLPVAFLAMGGIGFPGGSVYLRQDLMRSPLWRSAASLAGPGGTLAVMILLAVGLAVARALGVGGALIPALAFLVFLQATALVLNLMPVPGLDGYGVLRPFLPAAFAKALVPVERVATLLFMAALLWFAPVATVLFGVAGLLSALAGVSGDNVIAGWRAFQFWK